MEMTRDEIAAALAAIQRTLDNRDEVWRELVDSDGRVIRRIYRGAFRIDSRSRESDQEETS